MIQGWLRIKLISADTHSSVYITVVCLFSETSQVLQD